MSRYCVLFEGDNITRENFMITSANFYVPVVTLSINDNIKFLENIKQGFKRTVFWNKSRSEITTQSKNNNAFMIDPAFRNINRLFFLSFKNSGNDPTRNIFDKYYMSLVEIKDFNPLIINENQLVKHKQEVYENLWKCQEMMTIQQEIY